jgi:hypothetical protein
VKDEGPARDHARKVSSKFIFRANAANEEERGQEENGKGK